MRNQGFGSFKRKSDYGHAKKELHPILKWLKNLDPMIYIILLVVLIALIFFLPRLKLYEVILNEQTIGYTKAPEKLKAIEEKVLSQVLSEHNIASAEALYALRTKKTSRAQHKASTETELAEGLFQHQVFLTKSYLLQIEGENILSATDRGQIEKIVTALKEKLALPGEDLAQIQFAESVVISEQKIPVSDIMNPLKFTEAKVALLEKVNADRVYKVAKNDTISQIAKKHNVSIQWIQKSNPDLDINKISIGQKIIIQSESSLLHRK